MNNIKKIFWLNCFIVVALAFNLRAPVTSIGPLSELIKEHYNLSSAMVGMLTTLPLIAFGTISFLVTYFSQSRAILIALLLIICGEIIRSIEYIFSLYAGMALLGIGIAILNVILPSFIKGKFPHKVPQIMGLYSLVLCFSGISGIALSLPLFSFFGMQIGLAFWLLFAILAFFAYLPHIQNKRLWKTKKRVQQKSNLLAHSTTWKVTLFMGLQSFLAYATFAWYPVIIAEKGYNVHFGTNVLLCSQIIAVPAALFGPLLLGKMRNSRKAPFIAILCSMYALTFLILYASDSKIAIFTSAFLLGVPMGGCFGIVLLFISLKSSSVFIAAKLSAIAQGCGYLLASTSPFLVGYLHDYFCGFKEACLLLFCVGCILVVIARLAYKAQILHENN